MAAVLEFDPILGRKIRVEDWAGQGRSSLAEVRDALESRDADRSLNLIDCYLWETELLYRGYLAWINDWIVQIGRREPCLLWRYLERALDHLADLDLTTLPLEIADRVGEVSQSGIAAIDRDGETRLAAGDGGNAIPLSSWLAAGGGERRALEAAIGQGRWSDCPALLDRLHRAHKPYHDAYSDWLWLWMTMLAEDWGEEAMIALIADSGSRLRTAGLAAVPAIPVERQVTHLAAAMRGHRSGPGEEGDIRISEDDEKIVMSFDACGSGGRMRRRGAIDGLPARQDEPYRFGTTRAAHPMGWSRADVPYYCLHCAAYAEMQSIDQIGYPSRVTLFDPDHEKPCAWAFYKRPEDIPEDYFRRVGKVRDPARFIRK